MTRSVSLMFRWVIQLACAGLFVLALPGAASTDEILGPGDSIRVNVFENPDLTTEARISTRGTFAFPLLGAVQLGGLTPSSAAAHIAAQLKTGNFIREPQVTVTVTQVRSRQVSVLGQVARPGRYPLEDIKVSLTDMLAVAGGIAANGDEVVTVVRKRNGRNETMEVDMAKIYRGGNLAANMEIEGGDLIFVKRAPVFYIYGEVQHAGPYRWEPDMRVMQALSLGGGLTLRGTERGIKISRRASDGSLNKIDAQSSDLVQADDVIFVKESLF